MEQMGGFLMGNSHARGGVPGVVNGKQPIEMEGGEYVINKEAAQILGPSLLHRLNNADKGGYQNEYQEGGYTNNYDMGIDDEIPSLLELSLPILSNRLQQYTHGGPISPITPGGPGGMYAELGYEEPKASLEYQPMIMPYSFLGEQESRSRARGSIQYTPEGKGGFSKTGFGGILGSEAEKKRLEAQRGLSQNIAGQRQDYFTDWASALYQDMASGDFQPTLLGTNGDTNGGNPDCVDYCVESGGGTESYCEEVCSGGNDNTISPSESTCAEQGLYECPSGDCVGSLMECEG